jgi:hypothetical protein
VTCSLWIRNIVELAEFVGEFRKKRALAERTLRFPDLMNDHFEAKKASEMYGRFAKEAEAVFANYPALAGLR